MSASHASRPYLHTLPLHDALPISTHTAAPTMTAAIMAEESSIPRVINIMMVTAISVMPDSGDQLVRPIASERMTPARSEEHTSELHSRGQLVCRLLLD